MLLVLCLGHSAFFIQQSENAHGLGLDQVDDALSRKSLTARSCQAAQPHTSHPLEPYLSEPLGACFRMPTGHTEAPTPENASERPYP